MKSIHVLLLALMFSGLTRIAGAAEFSLAPSPVLPGQPAFLRVDAAEQCYPFDQHEVKRAGDRITVQIIVSDFWILPCPSYWSTPLSLALGSFDAGRYFVDVQECGAPPVAPCTTRTLLTLDVGGALRRATIPVFGWVALVLSCLGVVALAFVGPRPRG